MAEQNQTQFELGALGELDSRLQRIEERLSLILQQLAIMERALNGIGELSLKSFGATIDPKVKELAEKEAREQAEKMAKEAERRLDEITTARGGDHPPTQAEMDAAELL